MSWKESKLACLDVLKTVDEGHALDADDVNTLIDGTPGANRFRIRAILYELVVDGYIRHKLVEGEEKRTKYVYWGDL